MKFGFLNYGHGELGMYSCHTSGEILIHKLTSSRGIYI